MKEEVDAPSPDIRVATFLTSLIVRSTDVMFFSFLTSVALEWKNFVNCCLNVSVYIRMILQMITQILHEDGSVVEME